MDLISPAALSFVTVDGAGEKGIPIILGSSILTIQYYFKFAEVSLYDQNSSDAGLLLEADFDSV